MLLDMLAEEAIRKGGIAGARLKHSEQSRFRLSVLIETRVQPLLRSSRPGLRIFWKRAEFNELCLLAMEMANLKGMWVWLDPASPLEVEAHLEWEDRRGCADALWQHRLIDSQAIEALMIATKSNSLSENYLGPFLEEHLTTWCPVNRAYWFRKYLHCLNGRQNLAKESIGLEPSSSSLSGNGSLLILGLIQGTSS